MTLETVFTIKQHYKMEASEPTIAEHCMQCSKKEEEWTRTQNQRFQRMFQAVTANKKALHAIHEYIVLLEHFIVSDEAFNFFEDHYGKKENDIHFVDILIQYADCFTQEDKQWLLDLRREYDEGHTFELDLQVHGLQECFTIKEIGWDMTEHAHSH